ncbi:N-acetyl-gamma-glutamyl-phosphate reductase [Terrilactibacillus sp. BCM23-1]|uniref:N-acetyl-gamma-glutamyl-phosphate reductase n=1 Tax=Terrilactibacillus tamarindi TaxID=2599694 RepID=A0A6N8CP51_9BACI|nr:N-acetyl-gamma-glutamyl-phosphate reductase [Terrilactibacillus tamarindi]MTT31939.1 N-acetyl-gamma-glutamyl-phosphate reductase [Terrilactibacillus tamarindi]
MKVGIVGANGYSGLELIRLLTNHPVAEIEMLISHSTSGQSIKTIYPHLKDICEMDLEDLTIDEVAGRVELLFFATPSGVSSHYIASLIDKGIPCIDLSGDHRLLDPATYQAWYHKEPAPIKALNQAVYGLSEFFQTEIKDAQLIANPGCYPTATLLGILPALKKGFINKDSIIIDAKSGLSGAGRGTSLMTHFAETNDNLKAYNLGSHQHIPEIEQTLKKVTQLETRVTFSTHLVPMTRGIMCTIYAKVMGSQTTEDFIKEYKTFYKNSPFVRIREAGQWPTTKDVSGSNYCDIGFNVDERTGQVTIVSVIDNLVKGAAGQAIQNFNLMNGLDQQMGLKQVPMYP